MSEFHQTLILMAKEPRPGGVKTRLCPPLTPSTAAFLYKAMLADIVAQSRSSLPADRTLECWVHPWSALPWFERVFPGLTSRVQVGGDLPTRMEHAVLHSLSRRRGGVVLRNTDSPDLPCALIDRAFALLESKSTDLVFGPDRGGGYYLVGVSQPVPGLFSSAAMSRSDNYANTRTEARRRGLRIAELDPWDDVDQPEDLECLRLRLSADPSRCPETWRALNTLKPRWN